MISFKRYFLEKDMSIDHALNLFGLSVNDLGDKDLIKNTFRKLVFKNHPDRGGNEEIMKQINLAHEVLKRSRSGGTKGSSGFDWDALHKKYAQMGRIIKDRLVKAFDTSAYLKHFNKFSKSDIRFQFKRIFPNEGDSAPNSAGFTGEFSDSDRNTVFTIRVSVSLSDVVDSNALSFDDLDMNVHIGAVGFYGTREQKLSQRNWKFTSDHKFFKDPNKIFPSAKLKKIFSGSTSKRKFQKRDMVAFLTKKLKARWDGEFAWIPVGISTEDLKGTFHLAVFRTTFMRMATWGVNGIYERSRRVSQPKQFMSFPETEDVAKIFADLQKKSKRLKKADQISNMVDHATTAFKQAREKGAGVDTKA
jgi:hypothetical protein